MSRRNKGKPPPSLPVSESPVDDDTGLIDVNKLTEEGRMIVALLSEKFDNSVREFVEENKRKDEEISKLKQEVSNLQRDLGELRGKVDEVEANNRRDTIILSGDGIDVVSQNENTGIRACEIIKTKLNYVVPAEEVISAHRMGRKSPSQGPDRRSIIVKLRRPGLADDIVRSSRMAKPPKFFINESLTPLRSNILYTLRQMKRSQPESIVAVGSHGGSVYVWVRPPNPAGKNVKYFINTEQKLQEFCRRTLGESASELLDAFSGR